MKPQISVISREVDRKQLSPAEAARYEQLALKRLRWVVWKERWRKTWRKVSPVFQALRRAEEVRDVGPGKRPLSRYEWEKPDRGRWIY